MRVRFLLGPAGSGKTFRCLAGIRAALKANPAGAPLVLLAPKQATFQLERQLLADDSPQGYTRLHILSFERLARFILEKSGAALPGQLDEEGRVMVLRALLQKHEDDLKLFGRSARRPGFAQQLGGLLNELQQHQFTPARLRTLAERGDLRGELRGKLHDLALIFEDYAAWLAARGLRDGNHLLDAATQVLCAGTGLADFRIADLWLDGFAEMTPQELDLLAAILPFCAEATLAFCVDAEAGGNGSWLSIWSGIGKTVQQCRQRLEQSPGCQIEMETLARELGKNRFPTGSALAELERNWSAPETVSGGKRDPAPEISVVACPDIEAEATLAAREILKFVQAGHRFHDIAVLVRQLDGYHKPLARAFRRYGVPFFLDRRESVAHHPLAELTRSALRTVAFEWPNEDWFAALKAGFANVPEEVIDALENDALANGWRGKKWREPLPLESAEKIRREILPPFEHFARRLAQVKNSPDGAQLAGALRGLWDDLAVEKRLEEWNAQAPPDAAPAVHLTVFDQMNGWLANIERAFAGVPLPLADWLPVIEAGLASLTVGVIPPALDQVLVGAIDRARNPDLKFALVLGVNESVFPASPASPVILTEDERDELREAVPFGPNLRERLARERFYGYIACTRAGERLLLAYARAGADGKTLNPSPFIAHLQNLFGGLAVEDFTGGSDLAGAVHPVEIVARPESRLQPELWEIPGLAARLRELLALREPDEKETLSPAVAEKLYGPVLQSSVSRLEEFAQCQFKFFVRAGLRARERKKFEFDSRERGTFQHDVLKEFHERLQRAGKRWRDVTPETARELVGKIAGEIAAGFRSGLLHDSAQTRFEARALTVSLQDFIEVIVAWMHRQYDFDPAAVELNFGGQEAPEPAWKLDLGGGRQLALEGRIDRVDLWREPGGDSALAVVLDYKSGNKKLDDVLVGNGVQLQLLAYLGALRAWKDPRAVFGVERLQPAGAFYVSLRGKYEGGKTRAEVLGDADARSKAYLHNGRFDVNALPHLDRITARGQFNYRLTKDGKIYANSAEALPHPAFEALLDTVAAQLTAIGQRIFAGDTQVDPYRKGQQTACDYCDYRAVCRIDPWTHDYRVLKTAKETNEDGE